MHRPVFRSVLERTTRGVLPGGGPATVIGPLRSAPSSSSCSSSSPALFSTTAARAVLKNVPGRRERLAAAASELGALGENDSGSNSNKNNNNKPAATDARSLGAARPSGSTNPHFTQGAPYSDGGAGAGGSKIINVRSLPRRPPGASGSNYPGPSGVSSNRLNPAFRTTGPADGSQNRLRLPGRFGGGQGGRGGGRTGGRRRPGRRRAARGEDGGDKKKEARLKPESTELTAQQKAWLEARDVGVATAYEPGSDTVETLLGHGPAVSTVSHYESETGGPVAAALRAMRVLAGGPAFAGDTASNPEIARAQVEQGKATFFDTLDERARVDEALRSSHRAQKRLAAAGLSPDATSLVAPVRAETKAAILETAVRGLYVDPDAAAAEGKTKGHELFERLQRYRAKEYTYTEAHGRQFDAKVAALLPNRQADAPAAEGRKTARA